MGDDIGMWNIGAYHRGLMAARTPNIDELAAQGAIFNLSAVKEQIEKSMNSRTGN
jgi:arylsulfatase A-like enzyme